MEADWVRSVRDQCGAADVPFFFKQWGGVRKSKSGRELDGRTHDDVPERPMARTHVGEISLTLLASIVGVFCVGTQAGGRWLGCAFG
jgi:Protein of unknown function (DUF5131)